MSEYGITSVGFNPKPADIIEEDAKALLKQNFGENVDLTQQSPLIRFMQSLTTEMALLWIVAEYNFYNCFASTASGAGLKLLGLTFGIEIKEATPSIVELKIIKASSDVVNVPIGSLFQTSEGIIFKTDEALEIPAGDPATTFGYVNSTCTSTGEVTNVGIGTITTPVYTISGVDSSTNLEAAIGGTDEEEEEVFRKRIQKVIRATYTKAILLRIVKNVEGVKGAKIVELDYSYIVRVAPLVDLDAELELKIEEEIAKFNPITVEYVIVESINVDITVTGEVILNTGYNISTTTSEVSFRINEYISELGLDDDVIKNEIIHEIMDYKGVYNINSLTLSAEIDEEPFTYDGGTPTYEYALTFTNANDITEVKGIKSSVEHTFIKNTDYQLLSSPARIDWDIGGDKPDDTTEFTVTYTIPAESNGDIIIEEEAIARLTGVILTEP